MVDIPGIPRAAVLPEVKGTTDVVIPQPRSSRGGAEGILRAKPAPIAPEVLLAGGFGGSLLKPGEGVSPYLTPYLPEKQEEYSTSRIAQAAFERENTVASGVAGVVNGETFSDIEDPNFDIAEYIKTDITNTKYAPFEERFLNLKNEADARKLQSKIDREEQNTEVLASSGYKGLFFGVMAGILDPVNLIPVGGTAYKSFRAGKLVKGVLQTAGAGAVSVAASEGILQLQQETRTAEESAINIAGGALLSGVIGGGAALLTKKKFNRIAKKYEGDLQGKENDFVVTESGDLQPKSGGAAAVTDFEAIKKYYDNQYTKTELEAGRKPISFKEFEAKMQGLAPLIGEESVLKARGVLSQIPVVGEVTEKTAKTAAKITRLNPVRRVYASSSTSAKRTIEKLVNSGMYLTKNTLGIESAQSVENNAKQWRSGFFYKGKPTTEKLFIKFRNRVKEEGVETNIKDQTDFQREIGRAMRRGDESVIPEVTEGAKVYRSTTVDPLKVGGQNVNILAEDKVLKERVSKTAQSYFPRYWMTETVVAKEDDLRKVLTDKLLNIELPKIKEAFAKNESTLVNQLKRLKLEKADRSKIASLEEKLKNERTEFNSKFAEVIDEQDYVREIVDSILGNLKGYGRYASVSDEGFVVAKRGPLKERTLDFVRDEDVEQFLESDASKVLDRYSRSMSVDIELAKAFDGDLKLDKQLKEIHAEYDALASSAKTDVDRSRINKERQSVVRDISAMRDSLRGLYGNPRDPDSMITRGFRIARQMNYLTKMGSVVMSSIPDMANPILVHGMKRWTKGIVNLATNLNGIKLNIQEAKLAGNILENSTLSRIASFAEMNDPLTSGASTFEKYLDNGTRLFSKVNLMPLWNDTMKGFSSVLTQQRMIEEVGNLISGNIKNPDRSYLAFLGIGRDGAERINAQLKKYASKENGLRVANTEQWDDLGAVNLYRNALNLDVDRTIVTAGKGDVPLFMHTEIGKVLGQFKSFTFATTQQILISSLQRRDAAALIGAVSAVSLGMMTYYLKSIAAGRKLSDDPKKWIVEGVDKSGYLGVITEFNNILEKVTRGSYGINPMIDAELMTRYASRNVVDSLIGPTAGQIKDYSSIIGAISTGDISESDIKAFRRSLPGQNLFYLRSTFDEMEENLNNTLGK